MNPIPRQTPLSYAKMGKHNTRFLLIYGRGDDIVDPATQPEEPGSFGPMSDPNWCGFDAALPPLD